MSTNFTDLLYKEEKGVATITINKPKVLNAFSAHTVEELIQAFLKAGWDKKIGVIVLTGIGDRAFSTGGDQSAHVGNYDGRGTNGMPIEELQSLIRDVPKPVIARVQGYAIGGGNVLATICDLTIASDKAIFGQVGPAHGLGRSGLRHRLPRPRGRREEGARDLVPVPALHARRRRSPWGCATWWCRTTSSTPRSPSGARS